MSEAFDPYYQWLAIPPEEQPPHHYRLLGLKLFEDNPDVIESAADRQMKHVRDFQSGKNTQASQKLLNELSHAKLTLLTAAKKPAYDAQLRSELEAKERREKKAAARAKPPAAKPAAKKSKSSDEVPAPAAPVIRAQTKRVPSRSSVPMVIFAAVCGAALLLLVGAILLLTQRPWESGASLAADDTTGSGDAHHQPVETRRPPTIAATPSGGGDVNKLPSIEPPDVHLPTPNPPAVDPPAPAAAAELLAHWTFDESEGEIARDEVGDHDGAIRGATRVAAGVLGGALRFDGEDDVVVIGNPDALNFEGPISLAAWVRLRRSERLERRDVLTHGYHAQPDRYVYLRLNNTSSDQIKYEAGSWTGPSGNMFAGFVDMGYDQWRHVAGVHDGTTWRLYLDGQLVASQATVQGAVAVPDDWAIGAHPNGRERRFVGEIDDVRLYRGALSAQQVQALWEEGEDR